MHSCFKGQVAWISEKQQLPVKTSGKASFYGEKLHHVRFYDRRERNYAIYVHIDVNLDVNLDGKGVGLLLLDLPIVRKEMMALLIEIEATYLSESHLNE